MSSYEQIRYGKCSVCDQDGELLGENDACNKCVGSRFSINGIPVTRLIEDVLFERPDVQKVIVAMHEKNNKHPIIRLENDAHIYAVPVHRQGSVWQWPKGCRYGHYQHPDDPPRKSAHIADPELIPKLNEMLDDHLKVCDFCKSIINPPPPPPPPDPGIP